MTRFKQIHKKKTVKWFTAILILMMSVAIPMQVKASETADGDIDGKEGLLYKKGNPNKHKAPSSVSLSYYYSSGILTIYSTSEIDVTILGIELTGWNQGQYVEIQESGTNQIEVGSLSGEFQITCMTDIGDFTGVIEF